MKSVVMIVRIKLDRRLKFPLFFRADKALNVVNIEQYLGHTLGMIYVMMMTMMMCLTSVKHIITTCDDKTHVSQDADRIFPGAKFLRWLSKTSAAVLRGKEIRLNLNCTHKHIICAAMYQRLLYLYNDFTEK